MIYSKRYLWSSKLHDFLLKHGQLNEKIIYFTEKFLLFIFFYELKKAIGSDNNHLKLLGYQQSPRISSLGNIFKPILYIEPIVPY